MKVTHGRRLASRAALSPSTTLSLEGGFQHLKSGRWAILMFHDFTEGTLNAKGLQTRRSVHNSLLEWLKQNENDFWVAPLREVFYTHVKA
jgi:hypothetical protein